MSRTSNLFIMHLSGRKSEYFTVLFKRALLLPWQPDRWLTIHVCVRTKATVVPSTFRHGIYSVCAFGMSCWTLCLAFRCNCVFLVPLFFIACTPAALCAINVCIWSLLWLRLALPVCPLCAVLQICGSIVTSDIMSADRNASQSCVAQFQKINGFWKAKEF